MSAATPKPKGLLRRRRADGSFGYSFRDPALHKELPLGHDARLAYSAWIALRSKTIPPPNPLPVTWLLREFAIRKRPEDRRERKQLTAELKDLSDFLYKIGDPPVSELAAHQCQEFRKSMARRSVAVETRIRRLRQVWNWAKQEGLTESECPWTAQTRHAAICTEVADIVRQFLPPDARDRLDSLNMNAMSQNTALKDQALQWLQNSTGRAASKASEQLRKDGRPDLVAVVATCSLQTFLDAARTTLPRQTANAKLLIGHARVEKVASLRLTAHGTSSSGTERFGDELQGDPKPPDSSQGSAV